MKPSGFAAALCAAAGVTVAVAQPAGTTLHVTAYHDNSAANRLNPDSTAFVAGASAPLTR
jgi:hypothetical protein